MSPRDRFDRFMADVRNGTNFKLARLPHAHYRAWFSAVVPIGAVSKVRGAFMVNGEPATAEDMRLMAPSLSLAECRAALDAFRAVGMLEHDEELGGEWVHDFEEWNPEPKRASGNAERQKRYRDRQKASRNATGDVTRDVTSNARNAPEVEEEVEVTPHSPSVDFESWALHYEQITGHSLPARTTKAFRSVVDSYSARLAEGYSSDDLQLATAGAHGDEYRRENGYDVAESILRPTKIASLIAKGKLRTGGGRNASKTSAELTELYRNGAA